MRNPSVSLMDFRMWTDPIKYPSTEPIDKHSASGREVSDFDP